MINRFAKLLLDIRIDFCFLLMFDAISCSVLLRQSGMAARIDGVVSGSNNAVRECSLDVRKANHLSVLFDP